MKTAPQALLPFLTTDQSLTHLLEKTAGAPLKVQIIAEHYRPLTTDEKRLLGLPLLTKMLAWERQVLLGGNNQAWVKASSLFPISALQGTKKRLKYLKNTPIGYVLFKKNKRLPLKRYWRFDGKHYGRQTIYHWQGANLLIQETFLSEFEQFLDSTT